MSEATLPGTSKPAWQSKTMWGGIMIAVALGLQGFGITVDPDAAATDLVNIIDHGLQIAGVILVWYGRLSAKTPVSLLGG
jgi:hypothetical protein